MNLLLLLLLVADFGKLQTADTYYNQGKYAEALAIYQEEQKQAPDNPKLAFNIGNALLKLGRHAEAAESFKLAESLSKSASDAGNASYNRALSNVRQQDLTQAWSDARQAVRLNPEDADARANYEIISRMIARQQQQEQQQNQNQKNDQKKDQKQDQQKNDQQQDQQNKQDQKQDQRKEQQPQQQQQASISKEQAKRLLDALKKNEQQALLKKKEMDARARRPAEKDW